MNPIESYKSELHALSERERADREAQLCAAHRPRGWHGITSSGKRGATGIGDWLASHGIRGGGYRAAILRLGDAASPLWEAIAAGKLGPSRAAKMSIIANRTGGGPKEVLDQLEKYLSLPEEARVGKRALKRKKPRAHVRRRAWEVQRDAGSTPPVSGDQGRPFWAKLKAIVIDHVKLNSTLATQGAAGDLAAEFCRELDALVDTFQAKCSALRRRSMPPVSRGEMIDACAVLNHVEFEHGEDADVWLKGAARRKRTLAKLYHPDAHGGDERLRPQYEAVIAAYLCCETYARERNNSRRRPRLTVIKGEAS